MRKRTVLVVGLTLLSGAVLPAAAAGPCDAYYRFDGDLSDASGNGHHGQMVGQKGVPATPQFVDGRHGQALKLDGSAAMRAFVDLDYERCPQVTVAAWVNIEPEPNQMIFGASSSLHMLVSGTNMSLRSAGKDLWARNAVYANGGWMYIAGVWDADSRRASIHWRGRSIDGEMGTSVSETPPAIYFGALNDSLHFPAKQMIIDEVRIIGRALNQQQVAELQQSSGAVPGADRSVAAVPPAPASTTCAVHADCASGHYCAVDGTCHPDSHLPRSDQGATSLADLQAEMAERNAGRIDIDYESPTDLLQGSGSEAEDGRTLEEMQQEFAERNAGRYDVDYESPTDLLQGSGSEAEDGKTLEEMQQEFAERNAGRYDVDYESPADLLTSTDGEGDEGGSFNEDPAQQFNGPIGGRGGLPIGGFLSQASFDREPSGNVRDCSSFAEVVSDLATGLRDTIVEFAATNSCELIARSVYESQAALHVQTPDGYETDDFAQQLLVEVYESCVTSTTAAAQIPDKMLGLWNNLVGGNSWATIGPRELEFGKTHSGNLIAPGDRKFASTRPFFGKASSMGLQELDGRARVNARVCSVTMHNHYTRIASLTVNETPEERQNQSQFIVLPLDGIAWKFVTVYLDAGGLPGRNFKYELKVD